MNLKLLFSIKSGYYIVPSPSTALMNGFVTTTHCGCKDCPLKFFYDIAIVGLLIFKFRFLLFAKQKKGGRGRITLGGVEGESRYACFFMYLEMVAAFLVIK